MQLSDHENKINNVNIIPIHILLNHIIQNINTYFLITYYFIYC